MQILDGAIRFALRLSTWLALVAGAVLVAIALYAVVDALGRKILAMPLPGAVDVVSHGLGIAIALGLPFCTIRAAHVSVPALTQNMRGALGVIPLLAMGLSLLFLGVLALQVSIIAERRFLSGDQMWMLTARTWPVWFLIAAMSVFAGLCQFLLILARVFGLHTPQSEAVGYE